MPGCSGSADLHGVEAHKVVQLVVLDDGQEQQEEDDERHKLAAVVERRQGPCSVALRVQGGCITRGIHSALGRQDAKSWYAPSPLKNHVGLYDSDAFCDS